MRYILLVLLTAVLLGACSGVARTPLEPHDPIAQRSPAFEDGVIRFMEKSRGERIDAVTLSGGGQNGAYGVGLIQGWREIGIPRFHVVTGVSTGALIASHVFLDSAEADALMARFYTNVRQSDVLCLRNPLLGLTSDAFASMAALENLIKEVMDDDLIDQVAVASEDGGRLLLVGTVNLDTGGYHIWDLGAMARARQYDKYRAVLRASAGPPVAVPPVYLEGGMHCDGGTASSVFLPFSRDVLDAEGLARLKAVERAMPSAERSQPGTLYVVVNGVREPATERVEPNVLDIAQRALEVQSYSMRLGNLWYLKHRMGEVGGEFKLRFIPDELAQEAKDFLEFDTQKMRRIYERGLRDGRDHSIWMTEPPPLRPDESGSTNHR